MTFSTGLVTAERGRVAVAPRPPQSESPPRSTHTVHTPGRLGRCRGLGELISLIRAIYSDLTGAGQNGTNLTTMEADHVDVHLAATPPNELGECGLAGRLHWRQPTAGRFARGR